MWVVCLLPVPRQTLYPEDPPTAKPVRTLTSNSITCAPEIEPIFRRRSAQRGLFGHFPGYTQIYVSESSRHDSRRREEEEVKKRNDQTHTILVEAQRVSKRRAKRRRKGDTNYPCSGLCPSLKDTALSQNGYGLGFRGSAICCILTVTLGKPM